MLCVFLHVIHAIPQAIKMVDTFLDTAFEGGRHENRVE